MADDGFSDLYEANYARLVGQVYAFGGDLGDAQEAVQEAFIRAWERWPRLQKYDDPIGWVRTVSMRLAVSRWRKVRRVVAKLWDHMPSHVPEPSADSVELVKALKKLPLVQRRSIVLHYLAGMSVAEISASEGAAEGTIKARLHRGRAALASALTSFETAALAEGVSHA